MPVGGKMKLLLFTLTIIFYSLLVLIELIRLLSRFKLVLRGE